MRRSFAGPNLATAALLIALAFALRVWDFGNPVIHVDEQYYLLVGERLLHGAVPYVDIWDRKPIGLFLLYAAIRLLPGDGIVAYQIVATLFAAATAIVVRAAALRLGARPAGALAAGAAYLVWISLLGGRGGQAPIFYNLCVMAMLWFALGLPALTRRQPEAVHTIGWSGAIACALGGIAIQIKYTAAVEAAFYGAVFAWFLLRAGRWRGLPIIVAWLLLGVAPTLAAIGWYQMHGWLGAFWFANFTSIALRPGYAMSDLTMRLLGIIAILSPLAAAAITSLIWRRRIGLSCEAAFISGGAITAALIGFLAIGTFFDHYALPMIAPLATLAAPALGRSNRIGIGVLGIGTLLLAVERLAQPNDGPGARHIARIVAANDRGACPYVFIGDTITYHLAQACLPSAYAFPNFLAYTTEQGATGIDEAGEVQRILSSRPPVIVGSTRRLAIWNQESLAALRPVLARDYRIVASAPRADYRTIVWLRRDLPFRD